MSILISIYVAMVVILIVYFAFGPKRPQEEKEEAVEEEEEVSTKFTAKHAKFLEQPFSDFDKLSDLPAIGPNGAPEQRFKNNNLRYPFRVFGQWLLDGDDMFYDFCIETIKMAKPEMPRGTAAELCDAFSQKWSVIKASGTDIDDLDDDGSNTQKLQKFELASFDSVDRKGIADVVPGIGVKNEEKWRKFFKKTPTSRELLGYFLTRRSKEGKADRFIAACVKDVGMRKDFAETLAAALEEKWNILSHVY